MIFSFRSFQPGDQPAVKELILAGLVEHWGFLDQTLNTDLNDIQASYQGATFLVACVDNEIVGCGALVPRNPDTAEIVRMSVAARFRRLGLGTQILNHLLGVARETEYPQVILETTAKWEDAVAFYLRNGFQVTHYQDDDVFFKRLLTKCTK